MSYVNFNRQKNLAFATSADADSNTIYFTSDTHEIVINGVIYGTDLTEYTNKVSELETATAGLINTLSDNKQDKEDNSLLTTDKTIVGAINELHTAKLTLDLIYPIGSIYMSVTSTTPLLLFGGSWEQIQDTFLLAAGDSHTAGSVGGEETHTLTKNEMPRHNHMIALADPQSGTLGGEFTCINREAYDVNDTGLADTTMVMYAGKSEAHNNMPPYLTVYMWKRIG